MLHSLGAYLLHSLVADLYRHLAVSLPLERLWEIFFKERFLQGCKALWIVMQSEDPANDASRKRPPDVQVEDLRDTETRRPQDGQLAPSHFEALCSIKVNIL